MLPEGTVSGLAMHGKPVALSWGATERPSGCIIPRPRGSVPVACIPFLMSLAYLVGGAPRAASSPSHSGLTQWHVSPLHLLKLVCFPCLIYLQLLPSQSSPVMGAARRPSFFRILRVGRISTVSVLGPVPVASINPAAELCLSGRPRSRHLLGPLVLDPLTR